MSHSSDHFYDPLLDLFHHVPVLSVLKDPELDAIHQMGLTIVEQRGRIPFLDLQVTLLMQPRLQLSFWAMSAYYQLTSNFYPPILPNPSLQDCSQSLHLKSVLIAGAAPFSS